jgi:hypothetical protein
MMKALTALATILILLLCVDLPSGTSSANAATPRAEHCTTSVPSRVTSGLPEVRGIAKHGTLWALLFYDPPATAGSDLKIVLRMTGSGSLRVRALGPAGQTLRPQWVEPHLGSSWNRPGREWGTGWNLPTAGCWHLHAALQGVTGNVWLQVATPAGAIITALPPRAL